MIEVFGERIYLKSFTREEYHQFYQNYIADPIMDPNLYIYDKDKVDLRYNELRERESWYPVVGIFQKDRTIIGDISFKRIDYDISRCELGIALANDTVKGQGYGTEAFGLAIDYVKDVLKLKHIYADTMGSNNKMQRIFEKFQFQLIERVEHFYDMHDRWEDKLNYVLIIS